MSELQAKMTASNSKKLQLNIHKQRVTFIFWRNDILMPIQIHKMPKLLLVVRQKRMIEGKYKGANVAHMNNEN